MTSPQIWTPVLCFFPPSQITCCTLCWPNSATDSTPGRLVQLKKRPMISRVWPGMDVPVNWCECSCQSCQWWHVWTLSWTNYMFWFSSIKRGSNQYTTIQNFQLLHDWDKTIILNGVPNALLPSSFLSYQNTSAARKIWLMTWRLVQ